MKWLVSAATAAVLTFSAGSANADTVKVGLIADFTGAFATWGPQFQHAIEAYQALHGNSVKGPDGKLHQIEFIYRDSASGGPDKARQLAEALVLQDHVKFLAGFDLSPHAMAAADVATQAKIPLVDMNAATAKDYRPARRAYVQNRRSVTAGSGLRDSARTMRTKARRVTLLIFYRHRPPSYF